MAGSEQPTERYQKNPRKYTHKETKAYMAFYRKSSAIRHL